MKKPPLAKRLGLAIRERRKELGLSQDQFADEIDMHRAYYSAIERGEKNVTLTTIHRVAVGLKVAMADLLVGVDR